MYFILIDRFVDGDPTNNAGDNPESYLPYDSSNPEALKHYQGGDLAGITQSLDSLQAMGITMIWISPFIDNSNTDYVKWWPYHGYHPIDFFSVDEHFGTLADLKELVDTAHLKGLKIIFDMPFNQTAADHPWIGDASKTSWYNLDAEGQPYEITNWHDQTQIEIGELHGLPDLAQENPEVTQYLLDVSRYWIEETGVDGFRLDAVKHIPISFWKRFVSEIREMAGEDFALYGEVFWGKAAQIAPYANLGFEYLFDIPGYYAIQNTFNKGAPIDDFSRFYEDNAKQLGETKLATLIDNHDVARFNVGLGEDAWAKQRLALGWLMTAPGLPVIYSGTEYGMDGYPVKDKDGTPQDFLNRLPYPLTPDPEQRVHKHEFEELTRLRHKYTALSHGKFAELYKDWSIYAYLRSYGDENLLVCLNNASTQEFLSISVPANLRIQELVKVYGESVIRVEGNELYLRMAPNSLSVWEMDGESSVELPEGIEFTNRLSADYSQIHLFYYDPDSLVKKIEIAGDFNNWVPKAYDSFRQSDTLHLELPLKPGKYNYKFILNGVEWITDPNAAEFSIDPYGGRNGLLTVGQ